jgi:GNAT superfamily N-acetyltransferase
MSSEIQPSYRVATPGDKAVIVEMLHELVVELGPAEGAARLRSRIDDDIRDALVSPKVRIFLAEAGGVGVGLGRADVLFSDPIFRLRDDQRCGYIDQMYVRPRYRGRGVGQQLLRRCESWLREQDIAHVLLHAAPKALGFYEREGYLSNREMFKRL